MVKRQSSPAACGRWAAMGVLSALYPVPVRCRTGACQPLALWFRNKGYRTSAPVVPRACQQRRGFLLHRTGKTPEQGLSRSVLAFQPAGLSCCPGRVCVTVHPRIHLGPRWCWHHGL